MCSITSNCITGTKILVVLVVYRCYAVILIENSWGEKWRSHSSNKCFIMKYVCYIHDLTVCLALLRKLLVENRSKRYTIRQIKDHQWFNKNFNRMALGIYCTIYRVFMIKRNEYIPFQKIL